jgi:hypothetical protein
MSTNLVSRPCAFAWIVRSKELLRAPACRRVLLSLAHVHLLELALPPARLLMGHPHRWALTDACQARLPPAASTPRVPGPAPQLVVLTRARPEPLTPAVRCHLRLLSLPCLARCRLVLVPCRLVLVPCRLVLVPCHPVPDQCLPAPVFGLALAHGP